MFELQALWTTGRMALRFLEPIAPRYLRRSVAIFSRALGREVLSSRETDDRSRP